jgi:predicted ATPase/class 3 adenylate cyclase
VGGLPTGTVTFLFTDVEGSTLLLRELGDRYGDVLQEHHRVLRAVWTRHGGVEVDTAGDAFFVAFERADDACAAALAAQEALRSTPLRVRIGLHTGAPLLTEAGYVGIDVHRAARIADAAHGGQVVVSRVTHELGGCAGRDLGEHRLKDLAAPERLFQLGDGEFPPLRSLYRTNLPVQAWPLIGRAAELAEVTHSLREHRLVTLVGPGGSGKTRLALQAAAELAAEFPDGVWWVSLAAVRDPQLVLPTVASVVGVRDPLQDLAGTRLLLLLDNLEQVIEAAVDVAALAEAAPGARVLVTSRQPLRVTGEVEVDVPPLTLEHAVALFVQRASAVDRGFAADDDVVEICRRLDALPLALELAAARVRVLSAAAMRARLEQRLPLLTGGRRDAPERQRTLRATIAWTYDLLSDGERDLFRSLAVFRGGWALEQAEAICDTTLDELESLVEKSLVRRVGERYFMLETIREFAVELGVRDELRLRHARWFHAYAERLDPQLRTRNQQKALEAFAADLDNLRVALATARDLRDHELHASLAGACWYFWLASGRYLEGRTVLAAGVSEDVSPAARARFLEGRSAFETLGGDEQLAIELADAALALRRDLNDPNGQMRSLVHAANARHQRAEMFPEACALSEECLELARSQRDEWFEALALTNLGSLKLTYGDASEAEEAIRQAAELWRRVGDRGTALANEMNLAGALLLKGERREAIHLYGRVVHDWEGSEGAVWCLVGLARAASETDPELAARLCGAVDSACAESGYGLPGQERRWDERTRATLADELGPDRLESLLDEGRALELPAAVELALASLD